MTLALSKCWASTTMLFKVSFGVPNTVSFFFSSRTESMHALVLINPIDVLISASWDSTIKVWDPYVLLLLVFTLHLSCYTQADPFSFSKFVRHSPEIHPTSPRPSLQSRLRPFFISSPRLHGAPTRLCVRCREACRRDRKNPSEPGEGECFEIHDKKCCHHG